MKLINYLFSFFKKKENQTLRFEPLFLDYDTRMTLVIKAFSDSLKIKKFR